MGAASPTARGRREGWGGETVSTAPTGGSTAPTGDFARPAGDFAIPRKMCVAAKIFLPSGHRPQTVVTYRGRLNEMSLGRPPAGRRPKNRSGGGRLITLMSGQLVCVINLINRY